MAYVEELVEKPGPRAGDHGELLTSTLANGLRVAVQQVDGMTGCAVAVNYRAGFRDEPQDRAGFAHLFEHLMFQGSRHVSVGQHFAEIQAAGGTVNGNTFTDVADFHQTAPLPALHRILELEADRMAHLDLDQRTLDVQRRVVFEEINLQLKGRAYGGYPWTVLPGALYRQWENAHNGFGTTDELYRATVADCEEFYERYYSPANACVGVCADVDPHILLDRVSSIFGPISSRSAPQLVRPEEPGPLPDQPLIHDDERAPRPAFALGWRLKDPRSDLSAYAAQTVLSSLLTGGSHARLRADLRGIDAAVDTSVGLFGPLMASAPDTFVLVVHHHQGDFDRAQQLVDQRLDQVADGADSSRVRSAVLTTQSQHFKKLDSPAQRVRLMTRGQLLFGLPNLAEHYQDRLEAVTGQEVQGAAAQLATGSPRGTVLLRTEGAPR